MNENFYIKLKSTLLHLPQYEADTNAWERLSQQLDFNDKLKARLEQLPEHTPEKDIWQKLEKNAVGRKRPLYLRKTAWAAAASVAMVLGLTFYYQINKKEQIVVSEEMVESWTQPESTVKDTLETELTDYFSAYCANKTYVKDEPEFCEKNKLLQEIENKLKDIEQVINKYGDSPTLISTRIKLENSKAALIKDMVNKLAS